MRSRTAALVRYQTLLGIYGSRLTRNTGRVHLYCLLAQSASVVAKFESQPFAMACLCISKRAFAFCSQHSAASALQIRQANGASKTAPDVVMSPKTREVQSKVCHGCVANCSKAAAAIDESQKGWHRRGPSGPMGDGKSFPGRTWPGSGAALVAAEIRWPQSSKHDMRHLFIPLHHRG